MLLYTVKPGGPKNIPRTAANGKTGGWRRSQGPTCHFRVLSSAPWALPYGRFREGWWDQHIVLIAVLVRTECSVGMLDAVERQIRKSERFIIAYVFYRYEVQSTHAGTVYPYKILCRVLCTGKIDCSHHLGRGPDYRTGLVITS